MSTSRIAAAGQLTGWYLQLSKARLSSFVVASSMAGFAMAPVASFDTSLFLAAGAATALTSFCANCINQVMEAPYDSQMKRTQNRVLVRGHITVTHALTFGVGCGVTGVTLFYYAVNPVAAALGAANILLYTGVYTPMKRHSIVNTWIGAVVGAIPPLIGWTAATGGVITPAALLVAGVLYSWQFPHFNSLSWNLRGDYSRAGYRMMSVTNPALCRRVAVYHSLYLTAFCACAPLIDLTSFTFAVDTLPFNLYMLYLSCMFWSEGTSKRARKLFRYSLIYLPAVLLLMLISKKHWHEPDDGTGINPYEDRMKVWIDHVGDKLRTKSTKAGNHSELVLSHLPSAAAVDAAVAERITL